MTLAIHRTDNRTQSSGVRARALAISLAAHALLFLLFWLAGSDNLSRTLSVSLLIESEPQQLEIPDEETREISPQNKMRRRKKQSAGNAGQARKGAKSNSSAPATPDNPWGSYERDMFRRKSGDTTGRAGTKTQGTNWGNEKTGKTTKQGTQENVVIPPGDSKSATRWKKGASRRLVSLPAIDYPESIRKKSGQGQVELRIEVGADGRVEEVEILKSSGFTRLDINARNAYRSAIFSPSVSGDHATGVVVVTFRVRD